MSKVSFRFETDYPSNEMTDKEKEIQSDINGKLSMDSAFKTNNWIINVELKMYINGNLLKNVDYGLIPTDKMIQIDSVINDTIKRHIRQFSN